MCILTVFCSTLSVGSLAALQVSVKTRSTKLTLRVCWLHTTKVECYFLFFFFKEHHVWKFSMIQLQSLVKNKDKLVDFYVSFFFIFFFFTNETSQMLNRTWKALYMIITVFNSNAGLFSMIFGPIFKTNVKYAARIIKTGCGELINGHVSTIGSEIFRLYIYNVWVKWYIIFLITDGNF